MKRTRNIAASYFFAVFTILTIVLLYQWLGLGYTLRTIAYLILVVLFYGIFGVFSFKYISFNVLDVIKIILINVLACVVLYLFYFVEKLQTLLILYGLITFTTVFFKFITFKLLFKKLKVLLIGEGELKEELHDFIDRHQAFEWEEFKEIEDLQELQEKIDDYSPEIILNFKKEFLEDNKSISFIMKTKQNGTMYYGATDFYELTLQKLPIRSINLKWFLEQDGFEIFHNSFNRFLKRVLDIVISSSILLLSFPVMLITSLIIKLESKGPVIFQQKRVGKDNREFTIYKFRSMVNDAEKDGAQWAKKKDARITKFGHFIRKTRIDELPQLWNILKGEMSFVGPRPERKVFIDQLVEEIPLYSLRHTVKPGLTGWAQVRYRYASSLEDSFVKLQYDLYYIKHQNILLDLNIIYKTIKTIVFFQGR